MSATYAQSYPSLNDLPVELVLRILSLVDNQDLWSLSALSRKFHFTALPLYLQSLGIDGATNTRLEKVVLGYKNENRTKILKALRRSLYIEEIGFLSCCFPQNLYFLHDLKNLTRLIQALRHVGEVSLDFDRSGYWGVKDLQKNREILFSTLEAILAKGCRSLTLKNGELLERDVFGSRFGSFKRSLRPLLTLLRPHQRSRSESPKTLERVSFHSSIFTHPFLSDWLLNSLETNPIHTLSFDRVPHREMRILLRALSIPTLYHFTVSRSPFVDWENLTKFLQRHRKVESLTLEYGFRFRHFRCSRKVTSCLPNLTRLAADVYCIAHVLSGLGLGPSSLLEEIVIVAVDENIRWPSFLPEMTKVLIPFEKRITQTKLGLKLYISRAELDWMPFANDISQSMLRRLQCLEIWVDSRWTPFVPVSPASVAWLPGWLSDSFPTIERLVLSGSGLFKLDQQSVVDFERATRTSCKHIHSICASGIISEIISER